MKERNSGLTEYIAIYEVVLITADCRTGNLVKNLPPETISAADDLTAIEKAIRMEKVLDAIENSIPDASGDKKEVILKNIRNQTNKRIVYSIGYSSETE